MSLYNILDRQILLPLGDLFYGSEISRQWKFLCRTEYLSYQQILEIQNDKLKSLVKHAYESVPYYHKLFDGLGLKPEAVQNKDDLCKIPVLTKEIIRDNYDDMFSKAIDPKRFRKSSSGGSTGVPLQFCMDSHEWSFQRASSLRAWESYGLRLGDRIFSFGGNSIAQKKDALSLKNIYDKVIMRNYKFNSSEVDENSLMRHLESFKKIRPSAVRGYGSSLAIFARFIKETGYKPSGIKVVLTTGEVLMPNYRKELEETFGAPVFDAYGAGDGGIVSHECSCHNGLHITEELCVIEITDKEGNILPDGEMGYVTSTDLENYAFPFIRYHVGDMSYIKKEACSCGRHTRQFGEVMGRAGKLLYNKQGVAISPTMLPIMLYPNLDYHCEEYQKEYNKIDRFQIRQDCNGDILILLKMKEGVKESAYKNEIIANYKRHFVGSEVSLKIVDRIPLLPSGKEDYCVSEYHSFDN
jgi:phenylacetate-CoA ligase